VKNYRNFFIDKQPACLLLESVAQLYIVTPKQVRGDNIELLQQARRVGILAGLQLILMSDILIPVKLHPL
jgi:hypothetical protein